MAAEIHQFICLDDNYGVLLHDPSTGRTAAVDAPDAAPILRALETKGWGLEEILVTHHHSDHTQGLAKLKARYPQARIVAPAREADKIGAVDLAVGDGDEVQVGSLVATVIETPGHTSGHVCYYFASEGVLFSGDTLFALGCGRPFEEPAQVLHRSLGRLAGLPGSVRVYCGHEYTQSNARFALGVDGGNETLVMRAAVVDELRAADRFTLPSTIADERATNPFLRVDTPAIRTATNLPDAEPADVFAALRERKNRA